jgi:rod shape-determining protein MreC
VSDAVTGPFRRISTLTEENEKLQRQMNELLREKEAYQEALLENRRLEDLLGLKGHSKNFIATARVISRGPDYMKGLLILDQGRDDGILKDMVAVTPNGLAGKIGKVSNSFSNLLLVTNIDFSAAVRIKSSRREGIISGTGSGKCILKYIPLEESVQHGDIIITSGLDSLFPKGIPVGYVSSINRIEKGGHFQDIEVIPFQSDSEIEEVLIVK